MNTEELLKSHIREVPDFPKPGINFKDISPIFLQPDLIKLCIQTLADHWKGAGVTKVVGIESRGFLFGPAMAAETGAGFVIVRKAGKLPPETQSISYSLEYGEATMEMVKSSIHPGDRVVIHDDLLATGGTAAAAAELVTNLGATVVGFSFLIDLTFLEGRKRLQGIASDIHTIIHY